MAAGRPLVLLGAPDSEPIVLAVRRFAHGAAIEGAEQPVVLHHIGQRRVADPGSPAQLPDHMRGVAHALHPARDHELRIPQSDRPVGEPDCGHSRETDLVDGHRRNRHREPTADSRLTGGDLTFTGLKDLAEQNLVHRCGVDTRSLHDGRDRMPTELDRPERRQGAAVFSDRGAGDPGDDTVAHVDLQSLMLPGGRSHQLGGGNSLCPMKLLNLDHVGIAVPDLDDAIQAYETKYGVVPIYREIVEAQGVEEAMIPVGGSFIQLLQPLAADTTVGRFLERGAQGLHHVAYAVASIIGRPGASPRPGSDLDRREALGSEARGAQIAFVHPEDLGGTLIELVELVRWLKESESKVAPAPSKPPSSRSSSTTSPGKRMRFAVCLPVAVRGMPAWMKAVSPRSPTPDRAGRARPILT